MFERWDEVELDLRVEATLTLDDGGVPEPLLAAFGDDDAIALVRLRPFHPDGVLQALVEVLALLLPLGTRRLALGLPGRPVAEEGGADGHDPGALLVVATVEVDTDDEVRTGGRVLPLVHDGDCWQWREERAVALDADAWDVTRALGVLLQARPFAGGLAEEELPSMQAQLGRCLLLGHEVALSPPAADRLEPARLSPGVPRAEPLGD